MRKWGRLFLTMIAHVQRCGPNPPDIPDAGKRKVIQRYIEGSYHGTTECRKSHNSSKSSVEDSFFATALTPSTQVLFIILFHRNSLHWLYPHLIDVRQISGLKMLPDKSDTEHTSDGVPYPNSFSIIHVSSIWQMEKEKAEMKLAAASPQWKSRENVSVSSRTAGSVLGT